MNPLVDNRNRLKIKTMKVNLCYFRNLKKMEKTVQLNSGYTCPILGYGTLKCDDPEMLSASLKVAIDAGYRHIDTAFIYQNEWVIGEVIAEYIKEGKIKREDIFITTKLWGTHFKPDHVRQMFNNQLEALQTNYIDLYLMHVPCALVKPSEDSLSLYGNFKADETIELDTITKIEDTWKELERLVEDKLVHSIGVSNFSTVQVDKLLATAKIKPAMNQVEINPAFQNIKLVNHHQLLGIQVTGFSPFASPGSENEVKSHMNLLEDPTLIEIGRKHCKTPAQTILRWQIQRGLCVIPKSITPARIQENFNIWDFELTNEEMDTIKAMDFNKRQIMLSFKNLADHPEYPYKEDGSW